MLDTADARLVVAPIRLERNRFAALSVTVGDRELDERRLRLLAGLAHQAKVAIESTEHVESLERTFVSTVEALANALEASDEYTSSHARWITDVALLVGRALQLDRETMKRLELGALFHDIGKIGIPSEVLRRPGPLSDAEFELVKEHPVLGEKILAPIERLADVRPIVRSCHERWDGTGLPGRQARRRDPARVADRLRLRRVPRDDDRPPLPQAPLAGRGDPQAAGGCRARSSTRPSSRRSRASTRRATSSCSTEPRPRGARSRRRL